MDGEPHEVVLRDLSRSCQACVDGTWSCLYITARCQARCFYCPQNPRGPRESGYIPNAESMLFPDPEFYADYVAACGVDAVGISGGEPLMELDRVVSTVAAVKERTGGRAYVHIYTNGLLVDRERLATLREVGVDELRFDITACEYDTRALALAREYVDTLTVEIPAVPEDEDRLIGLLGDLEAAGVDHLNLHQLAATRFNAPVFIERGYTLLHQRPVAVMESELAALRVLSAAIAQGVPFGVNYCSPVYKTRFQRRRNRVRVAALARRGHESVTRPGYLRSLVLHDVPDRASQVAHGLRADVDDGEVAGVHRDGEPFAAGLESLPGGDLGSAELTVSYFLIESRAISADDPPVSGDDDGWEDLLRLERGRIVGRRKLVAEAHITQPTVRDAFLRLVSEGWDESREAAHVRSATVVSAQELKALLAEWFVARSLRPREIVEEGLGAIE